MNDDQPEVQGDCRKKIYRNAPDFRAYSRRASRRIASYVTAGTTRKTHEKTSRPVCFLTKIAQGVRPDLEVMTRRRLPYFVGFSGQTVGSTELSMHLVVIRLGARSEPHIHDGCDKGIYVLQGRVRTRWRPAPEHKTISQAGVFLFVPPDVPHEAINLRATEPARAVVARKHPAEQNMVEP